MDVLVVNIGALAAVVAILVRFAGEALEIRWYSQHPVPFADATNANNIGIRATAVLMALDLKPSVCSYQLFQVESIARVLPKHALDDLPQGGTGVQRLTDPARSAHRLPVFPVLVKQESEADHFLETELGWDLSFVYNVG